jgi:cardiolipin synthase
MTAQRLFGIVGSAVLLIGCVHSNTASQLRIAPSARADGLVSVQSETMVAGMHNDNWLSRQNSIRLYERLLGAGIELYEYERTLLHHKTMIVDGVWGTVGTANFDGRSFMHDEESNVCFHDAGLVEQMEATFRDDLQFCRPVDAAAWRHRGVFARSQEMIAAVFQEQV